AHASPALGEKNPVDPLIGLIDPALDIAALFEEIENPVDTVAVLEKPLAQLTLIDALQLPEPDEHPALLRCEIVPCGLEGLPEVIAALGMGAIDPEAGRFVEGKKLDL